MPTEPPAHEQLAALLLAAERPVALTGLALGAIAPTEEGAGGDEWSRRASLEHLLTEPADFWAFYHPQAEAIAARTPGPGHEALARLERAGVLAALVTQAVDHLHAKAGTLDPVEVHGNVLSARCTRCGERYALPEVGALIRSSPDGVPRCTTEGCAFPLRPAGTLWGEPLVPEAATRAWALAGETDLFLVLDSQLRTVPVSLLPSVPLTRGVPLALVGTTPTQYDRYAELVVRAPSPDLLVALADLIAPAG